ncbi:hypothetical protein EST38_g7601 [Candolleomyces aberdarensis]|uniref:BTB domain-containing protein n=1 Tax=Candolleomyces aberdarensis TaxID=2316362 RepID=A0A4Q2DGP0_9AGAR|nr:hypothetical protein EST38_g7601 [Candolleomyces aberdarensis]
MTSEESTVWSTVFFKVKGTIFQVPPHRFTEHSEDFANMFHMPRAGHAESVEGKDKEHPIVLDDYEAADFRALMKVLYPAQYLCNFGQYREECSGCPSVYSNAGEMLDGQKILALTHNDGWSKFDQVIPQAFVAVGDAPQLLKMIYVIMKRLKNELKEPGLADALKPYYKKWRKIVKTDLARWMHEVNRLPPEDPEEGETEKGEEAQEELDSSTGKVLR